MAKRAFQGFKPKLEDHDTFDSAYQQRRPLSLSLRPRSYVRANACNFLTYLPPLTRTEKKEMNWRGRRRGKEGAGEGGRQEGVGARPQQLSGAERSLRTLRVESPPKILFSSQNPTRALREQKQVSLSFGGGLGGGCPSLTLKTPGPWPWRIIYYMK